MRRSAATMRLLPLLAALCVLLHAGQARPQRAAPGPHLHPSVQLSGAAANSMAPLTSEWRDESVRRLSAGPEGDEEVALSQSPYAWKPLGPLVSESRRARPSGRTSRDQQQPEQAQQVTAEALPEPLPSAAALIGEPVTAPSALSSPSGPSSPSSPSSPSAPTAPTGASPIGESLKEVASQLISATAEEAAKPHVQDVQDIRTPPIVKMQDLRKSEIPKPVMVSATVSTESDHEVDEHSGFQGVAEPVVLPDEHMPQALPQHMPLRTAQPAVSAPMRHGVVQHQVQHQVQADLKKANNASASPMTTAEPQPSTTASDRISTWILLSGTHSSATTPSSLKKRPSSPVKQEEHAAPAPVAHPAHPAHAAAKVPGTVTVPANAKPAHPQPAHAHPQPARQPPAVRKPVAQQRVPARKPTTTTAAPTTTTTTSTTPAPSMTPKPVPPPAAQQEYVKISEAIVSTSGVGVSAQKDKPAENKKPARPVPAVHTDSKQANKRPIQAQPDKTKVSSASVPFNTAIAFRRKPIQSQALPKPAALKTPATTTTTTTTTTTPAPVEELTTLPPTFADLPVTTDADLMTTTMPTITTKKPKRAGSSAASKKKKKKKNNKTRRRRPTKKTSSAAVTAESKIGHEGNATKMVPGTAVAGVPGGPGQNGISTKIYNYLAREVMPSVSVGIIGLVVTAGLAGLFLYPFGGGIAARRTYDTAPQQRYPGPGGEHMYYYESYADQQGLQDGTVGKPEEEVLGQVFSGMQQDRNGQQDRQGQQQQQGTQDTRYAASPSIYGGNDSGPPDAQYPDSYSRYDSSGKGSSYRPAAEANGASDLRQGTGYSSVSVNGQGQVTGYADPSPPQAPQVETKFEPLGTLDALQRTRYDVDTPISADQVDLTYASVGESAPNPNKKKAEESPYVVGSSEAQQSAQTNQGTRYHSDSDAASHVDITYGSSGSDQDAADPKPGNRYSVRVSGGAGQVALAYGSQPGADQDKADSSGVDLTYGAGLDMDSRYATANGAQPRALVHDKQDPKADGKPAHRRRRRSATGNDVDDDLNNEIDGPAPAKTSHQVVDSQDKMSQSLVISSTAMPEESLATTTVEAITTTDAEPEDKREVVTDAAITTLINEDTEPLVVVTTNDILSAPASDVRNDASNDVNPGNSDLRDTSSTATTTTAPVFDSTSNNNNTSPADDALSTLINIFRRVAEFKLRVGMNLLRGTSEAVTRYIGGMTKRMEAAAEHLHTMREQRSQRSERSQRTARAHSLDAEVKYPTSQTLRRRTRDVSRSKHQLKKILLKAQKNKKEH